MARKRMILEEIEDKELLVPGSVDNPIKLTERQKNLLLRIHMITKDGKIGFYGGDLYCESRDIMDRLYYLGLVETIKNEDLPENKRRLIAMRKTFQKQVMPLLEQDPFSKEAKEAYDTMRNEIQTMKATYYRLTKKGEELLLKGKVVVSI